MRYRTEPHRAVVLGEAGRRARQSCASARVNYAWLDVDVCLTRAGTERPRDLRPLEGPREVSRFLHEVYPVDRLVQEVFFVLCVNSKNVPVGLAVPHRGGVATSVVDLKTAFKAPILLAASGVVYAHNHPSGDPTPSPDDNEVTERLREAGRIVGVRFVDHLILTVDPDRYYSYSEASR